MGCFHSKEALDDQPSRPQKEAPTTNYNKPRWKSREQLSIAQLQKMRDEFWDTQPHYGGSKVIWDAIRAACEAEDMATTRLLLEAAGVIIARSDMTAMYDEQGAKYDLPKYVLSQPTHLMRSTEQQQQLELQGSAGPAAGTAVAAQ